MSPLGRDGIACCFRQAVLIDTQGFDACVLSARFYEDSMIHAGNNVGHIFTTSSHFNFVTFVSSVVIFINSDR